MKKSRSTDEPIIGFCYQVEAGVPVKQLRLTGSLRAGAYGHVILTSAGTLADSRLQASLTRK